VTVGHDLWSVSFGFLRVTEQPAVMENIAIPSLPSLRPFSPQPEQFHTTRVFSVVGHGVQLVGMQC
jgi:hypothetical protein